jgi:hypothetical protein
LLSASCRSVLCLMRSFSFRRLSLFDRSLRSAASVVAVGASMGAAVVFLRAGCAPMKGKETEEELEGMGGCGESGAC